MNKIINDEDEIVKNISAYCVDKTLENLSPELLEFISFKCQSSEAEFTREDMDNWYFDIKNIQLATDQREENIRQLKGGTRN